MNNTRFARFQVNVGAKGVPPWERKRHTKDELAFAVINPTKGVCPAGGAHDATGSSNYVMMHGFSIGINFISELQSLSWCLKCAGSFHDVQPGRCPKGGGHDKTKTGT